MRACLLMPLLFSFFAEPADICCLGVQHGYADWSPAVAQDGRQHQETRGVDFFRDLAKCLSEDKHLRELVDKAHPLPSNYAPQDLITLRAGAYRLNVQGIKLRRAAAESLAEMSSAARADGVVLTVSSAYRSYSYQQQVNSRIVRERGQRAADRVSARPGHSQHQTGLAVDFAPLDNSFSKSAAGRWMTANAQRFGWTLSYPEGLEGMTGYQWESWHYRYVGKNLASFIEKYFNGVQQEALAYIHDFEHGASSPPSSSPPPPSSLAPPLSMHLKRD
ncbi:MAG: M15 family metallopeptidase [Holophagaceae bacterium]|nr:M15 family metallopeptidase [Holophagaceae bacterium]